MTPLIVVMIRQGDSNKNYTWMIRRRKKIWMITDVVVDPVEVDPVVVAEYDIAIEAKTQTDKVQSD